MQFVPNQLLDLVLGRESGNEVFLVLPYSFRQIARYSDVERAVTLISQYLDVAPCLTHSNWAPAYAGATLGHFVTQFRKVL